ncbi:S1 family peptidase [Paractinoplanes atraurantiacus]|uniref:Trypsin n=1 Tax=Paractinoplanes atraurantiacus TaxID=1036182 RepID=A0A285H3K3_9ACTN|nr:S1 family peptidase [Actinoplanes atraurantiacus]SNY30278.1 Trypsin [Actinoplanes atraurantiacus]
MRFLSVVFAALMVICPASPAAAIAYGENARDGAYPFAVLLTMKGLPTTDGGSRDSSCSGALIAERWVITAGHCFRDANGKRVSRPVADETIATIGRIKVNGKGGHEVRVVEVRQSDTHDVALAELASPVTGITPLRLATTAPAPGETVRLTGFGLTTRDGEYVPVSRLQTGRFRIDHVGDSLLETTGVAPHDETSPCPHDSGGPYFQERKGQAPVLVAVVSSGPGCPHAGPDHSARVDNINGWITTTITTGPSSFPVGWIVALVVAAIAILWTVRRRRLR